MTKALSQFQKEQVTRDVSGPTVLRVEPHLALKPLYSRTSVKRRCWALRLEGSTTHCDPGMMMHWVWWTECHMVPWSHWWERQSLKLGCAHDLPSPLTRLLWTGASGRKQCQNKAVFLPSNMQTCFVMDRQRESSPGGPRCPCGSFPTLLL
jgi:hypothetical protein